jgi:predicted lipoprotein with Yx(FWY)xxD motif
MTVKSVKMLGSAAAVAAMAVVLAGCGSSSSSGGGTPSGGSNTVAAGSAAGGLNTASTSIGTVLVSPAGRTVYMLVGDTASHQTCTSSCQAFWPPVMSGGKILVVNGHPVFTFTQDTAAGQTHGQNAKDTWGTWLALDAKGNPVAAGAKTTTPSSGASSSSSGGGGYGY